jgi:hypothetical protein
MCCVSKFFHFRTAEFTVIKFAISLYLSVFKLRKVSEHCPKLEMSPDVEIAVKKFAVSNNRTLSS